MRKTRQQVRDDLGLDDLPDDEFMQILAAAGEGPIVPGPRSDPAEGHTPRQIAAELSDAIVDTTVGSLLARARAQAGLSLREVGTQAGVTRGRIQQLETSENIELATLVRVADALGYDVQITLVPERSGQPPLSADLSGFRG